MESSRITNIAHRGASSYAPENTFAAFDLARSMGVKDIELDVHFTNDDHIVVIHDESVDRTTNGSGHVRKMTLEKIRSLDAGLWFSSKFIAEPIPTLGEVLERYKDDLNFHIEIKAGDAPGLATRTCDLVRGYGVTNSTTITSFDKQWLVESKKYAPEIPTGWLVPLGPGSVWKDGIVKQALDEHFSQVCPRAELISTTLVNTLHSNGFEVRCHGVFNEDLMIRVINSGADGMTVNFPDKLRQYLITKGLAN
ncbi:MAG: glycerophosphodiester phosphodiesterase family protein [Chloroflexota bacterium]|nr:glycerophosphodiester phosphodiesterase family protein [Chloroflexota bacterium]